MKEIEGKFRGKYKDRKYREGKFENEIVRADELGYNHAHKMVWCKCKNCGALRWIQYGYVGTPREPEKCHHCTGREAPNYTPPIKKDKQINITKPTATAEQIVDAFMNRYERLLECNQAKDQRIKELTRQITELGEELIHLRQEHERGQAATRMAALALPGK